MTKEEAAKILEYPVYKWALDWDGREDGLDYGDAIKMAITALRAQQNELDRSRWEGCHYCDGDETVMELDWIYGLDHILTDYKFCPMCGRPLTEEAWAEPERRINGGTTDQTG